MSSDHNQSHSDLSLVDNQGQKTKGGSESSDSESSANAMDETPDSLQDELSSLESQPSSLVANIPAAPSEDTQGIQRETAAKAEARGSEEAPGRPDERENDALASTQDQTLKTPTSDTPTQQPSSEDSKGTTPHSGSGKGTKAFKPKDQETDRKNSKNKTDTATTRQPALDQNANVKPDEKQTARSKQKGKNQQDPKQKPAAEQQMVFGPQRPSKVMLTKMYEK